MFYGKPWLTEPNEWKGYYHGIRCVAKRDLSSWSWSGYAEISHTESNLFRDPEYARLQLNCHGGIKFWGWGKQQDVELDRCVGFRCNGSKDICPKAIGTMISDLLIQRGATYKTLTFVKHELEKLCYNINRIYEAEEGINLRNVDFKKSIGYNHGK